MLEYDRYLRVSAAAAHHVRTRKSSHALTLSQNASKAVCARTGTAFGAKAVVAASGRSKAAANLMVDWWLVCSFLVWRVKSQVAI